MPKHPRTKDPEADARRLAYIIRAAYAILETYETNYPQPRRIRRARRQLRRDWPELAGQLDLLTALTRYDPEPVQ